VNSTAYTLATARNKKTRRSRSTSIDHKIKYITYYVLSTR